MFAGIFHFFLQCFQRKNDKHQRTPVLVGKIVIKKFKYFYAEATQQKREKIPVDFFRHMAKLCFYLKNKKKKRASFARRPGGLFNFPPKLVWCCLLPTKLVDAFSIFWKQTFLCTEGERLKKAKRLRRLKQTLHQNSWSIFWGGGSDYHFYLVKYTWKCDLSKHPPLFLAKPQFSLQKEAQKPEEQNRQSS